MLDIVMALFLAFRSTLRTRRDLALENLALRSNGAITTPETLNLETDNPFRRPTLCGGPMPSPTNRVGPR